LTIDKLQFKRIAYVHDVASSSVVDYAILLTSLLSYRFFCTNYSACFWW